MSSYGIAVADVSARLTPKLLAQVTDDVAGTTINTPLVEQAILDAEAEFHTYASVYYVTPISAAAADDFRIARKIILDLTAWNLAARRPSVLARSDIGETLRKDHDATLAWLRGLSSKARSVQLTGSAEKARPQARSGGATVVADESLFADLSSF